MPTLIGTLPQLGIKSPEDGIFVESLDFDGKLEKYEQKDHRGRICGVGVIDESIGFTMAGELPAADALSIRMAASLALQNEIPDIWCEKPAATTVFVENVKHTFNRSDAAKLNITGTIYPFGSPAQS